ncbi:MAG TPA: hypothetical protein VHB98_00195 [Chloroflexota bacterium]|jgi:hypothetical protein|nr:hypothetical protein [Chloroflexota bacterium]
MAGDETRTHLRDLISRRCLQRILGAIWLLDGLLQLQPSMFTSNLTNGIMQPATQGQPSFVGATLQAGILFTGRYLVPVNAAIALVQLALGIFLLCGWFVRPALLLSVVWSLCVWYGGEGLGMLLTGRASVLTGAPGAVMLYALLGLGAYPTGTARGGSLLSRQHLRWLLAGCWGLAAVLQVQPVWWQPRQIAQAIAGNESPGTLNGAILDPSLRRLAHLTSSGELPLNVAFVIIALGLAIGLAMVGADHIRPLLAGSIALSLLLWCTTEGCGQLLTGTATDVNSGPLLVLLALVCWPPTPAGVPAGQRRYWQDDVVHRPCLRRQEVTG